MEKKVGRNDPCPCGSGKKYKHCCIGKDTAGTSKLKFKAKLLSQPKSQQTEVVNLMDRTFGNSVEAALKQEKPPVPPGMEPPEEFEADPIDQQKNP